MKSLADKILDFLKEIGYDPCECCSYMFSHRCKEETNDPCTNMTEIIKIFEKEFE